jgi:hypothetical protein
MSESLGRTRTAYDFERYATHGLRRYLKMFEIPRPPESNHREILLTLPRPEDFFKSHENRNLTVFNEPWSKLEFINPIVLSRNLVLMCASIILLFLCSSYRLICLSSGCVSYDSHWKQKECQFFRSNVFPTPKAVR